MPLSAVVFGSLNILRPLRSTAVVVAALLRIDRKEQTFGSILQPQEKVQNIFRMQGNEVE